MMAAEETSGAGIGANGGGDRSFRLATRAGAFPFGGGR